MRATLEAQVRQLDDETKSIAENARNIAVQLDAKLETIEHYLYAKRNNYSSHFQYLEALAQKNGTSCREKNRKGMIEKFGSVTLYLDLRANKKGFENHYEYEKWRAQETYGFETLCQLTAFIQGKPIHQTYRQTIEFVPFSRLKNITAQEDDTEEKEKLLLTVQEALSILSEREKYILTKRYFENQTQEQTGEELAKQEKRSAPFTKERIRQIESGALGKMKRYLQTAM